MTGLRITDEELRRLLVERLEIITHDEFERARAMAARLRVPLERALVERGRIPLAFLLRQIADAWNIRFLDLRIS